MTRDILRVMMEDVTEKQQGHRNVEEVVVDALFEAIDFDRNGELDYEEFQKWWLN